MKKRSKKETKKMQLNALLALLVVVGGVIAALIIRQDGMHPAQVMTYDECVTANGGVVTMMYPAQCTYNGETFTETVSSQVTNPAGMIGERCDLTPTMAGHTYTSPYRQYSFCVPDGWNLFESPGATRMGGGLISMNQNGYMTYEPGVTPTVELTGGKDGPNEFSVFINKPEVFYLQDYTKVGMIEANGVSGTVYTQYQDTYVEPDVSDIPYKATSYVYYFTKDGASLEMQTYAAADQPNQFAAVEAMAKTITFNP